MYENILLGRWLRVVIWAGIIGVLSGSSFSFERTLRVYGLVVSNGSPLPSASSTAATGILVLRKIAHVLEYAVLTGLLWRAISAGKPQGQKPWSWKRAGVVLLLIGVCALADEFRQSHTPPRRGQSADVVIDVSGGLVALTLLFIASRSGTSRESAAC